MFNKFIFLLVSLFSIIVAGCAHVEAPSGGSGIKTVPVVVESSVKNGAINFVPEDISIEFNSYMNRSVVIENLQISPTIKYSYKWSAKTLNITFTEELKPNQTYSVSIGGKYADYYGNTAETSFYTCFSTGNIIDTGKISGKIYATNYEGYSIFCYLYEKDSIDYIKDIPDYKILAGGNGEFVVPALKDGKYIVLVVKDIDKDGIVTQLRDTIGVPPFISEVINAETKAINFVPNYVFDTIPPNIKECKTVTTNQILIIFSEEVNKDTNNQKIYISNENNIKIFPNKIDFPKQNKTDELLLDFDSVIDKNNNWKVCFDSNIIIKDMNNNFLKTPINIDLVNETDSILAIDTTKSDSTASIDTNINKDTNNYLYISGKISSSEYENNSYLIIMQKGKENDFYKGINYKQTKISSDNTFRFDSLLAGEYEIFYFVDANNNEIFDRGKLIPFEFSEQFYKIEQNVKLNSRWNIDNFNIEMKKAK